MSISDDRLNELLKTYSFSEIKRYHLDIPVEELSNGACTPDGILKKTAGMEYEDIIKAGLPSFENHVKSHLNRR
jgi:hypothetical protein